MERKVSATPDERVTIRRMRESDIGFANSLREIAGWNQTERDWRGYLAYEPEGCFVAEVDGKPAGTAITIRYGDKFGWIGMVLVHPDQRRLGIGSQLLRKTISYLKECGVRGVKLDATPMGKKVYVPLGFVDEYELSRYEAIAPDTTPSEASHIVPYVKATAAEIARLDAEAFGADRPHVLAAMSARDPELCFAAKDAQGLRGFLIARHGARAVQVGPWIARDAGNAAQLLIALLNRVGGRTVFIDVPAPNVAGVELMQKFGFRVQRTLTRMYLGENTAPGVPPLVYSLSSPEKG